MKMVKVREWSIPETHLARLFKMFVPYREKHGLELGFELFFEDHIDFCLKSGLDAVETILLHDWKGKHRYKGGMKHRYVRREYTDIEWRAKDVGEWQVQCESV